MNGVNNVRSDVNRAIWKIFRAHGVKIPVAPKSFRLVGGSGKHHHDVFFCEACGTTLWSRYRRAPGDCLFVRAGTLDNPTAVAPDVHIFTRSKVPWLDLPEGARTFPTTYNKIDEVWSAESRERLRRNISGGS